MAKDKITSALYERLSDLLDNMKAHPESITEQDRSMLSTLYSKICKGLGISEHSRWEVQWRVEKWADTAKKLAGFEPDEIAIETQNIIVDVGANEMLKLITGTGGTVFGQGSYIVVGNNATAENATQTGVIATAPNRAAAAMDSSYPMVNDRQMVFRASFGDSSANFDWKEIAIMNGNTSGSVAMNRKVADLGTKKTGTWTIQVTVTLTSE